MAEKNDKKRGGKHFSEGYQPPSEAKRVKKRKTILKESIGLESWEAIQNYILTEGAGKFTDEINTLKGKSFIDAYLQALEYFKPKLARTEHTGKGGTTLFPPTINVIGRKPND